MKPVRTDTIDIEPAASRFDALIEWLLLGLLAFMPLAFGAVAAWSEQVVIAVSGALALVFTAKLVCQKRARIVWTWAYLPAALFILLAVLQLWPLPAGVVEAVSPETAAVKTELLGDLPNAGDLPGRMTLSFYPQATVHGLRLIIAVTMVFVIVVNVYRRPQQITRLLAGIALIGGAVALLALAQVLFGNGKIYWFVPAYDKAYSGTFINHSHYGQFMNLAMGAALGLLLVKLHEAFRQRQVTLPEVAAHLSSPEMRVFWYCAGMIVLGTATMFISLTRGGMVSLLIAGAFTAVLLAAKRSLQGRGWVIASLALCSFIGVLYIGFDAVYDRLATLRDMHDVSAGRGQIVRDIASAWTKFPLVGTGLGTHDVVYPMFDRATISSLASHAENEYAQTAEEMGLLGLVMLVLFAGIIWRDYFRNVRRVRLPIRSAAFGLGFGLLAVTLHSFSDFGQHLPANACLTAVSCGLLVALAQMHSNPGPRPANPGGNPGAGRRLWRILALGCVVAVFSWALAGANGARRAEGYWKQALRVERDLTEKGWLGSDAEFTEILSYTAAAADLQPRAISYRHWLNAYRWRAISRVADPNSGQIIMTQQSMEFVRRIVAELHQARALCPTFGPTYCVAGQLERFVLDDPAGAAHIRTGYRLAPYDATTCFTAGLLDAQEGKLEDSLAKFTRAVQLSGDYFPDVVDVYVFEFNRPDLAVSLAGDDYGRLGYVAGVLSELTEHQDLADQARASVARLLKEKCSAADAPASALATLAYLCARQQDHAAAIEYFRRALVLDYGQVQWRLAQARCLSEMNLVPEAMHEARICLRLRPQMTAATRLIEELSLRD